jgi:hypothetical protein
MVAWAPLLVLTLMDGRFLSGVTVPFLYDFEVHTRLLVSLPLLIVADVTIHRRMKTIMSQFVQRQIVTPPLEAKLGKIIDSALRLRNSKVLELALLVFVFVVGGFWWRQMMGMQSETWYSTLVAGKAVSTHGGFWYQFVSVPVFQSPPVYLDQTALAGIEA